MTGEFLRKARGVSSRIIDGRAVIVVMPRETLHSLNSTGTFLWAAIDEEASLSSLIEALASRYGLDETAAGEDVARFVEQLTTLGAVEVSSRG